MLPDATGELVFSTQSKHALLAKDPQMHVFEVP
jgi:hypothetical protein